MIGAQGQIRPDERLLLQSEHPPEPQKSNSKAAQLIPTIAVLKISDNGFK